MANAAPLGVGLIGCGTVGSGVVKLLLEEGDLYARRSGRRLELKRVLVRSQDIGYKTQQVPPEVLTTETEAFFKSPGLDVVVELAGGKGIISQFVRRALSEGKHVVTANKALLAAEGPDLFALAHQHGVVLAFEASCCGGIPVIAALQSGLMANRITALYGILNGTCNYILTEMTQRGKTYTTALREAQEKGFAEANPTLDVSGRDSAHKLAILASLAFGVRATEDQVPCVGVDTLDLVDVRLGEEMGYRVKLLGMAEEKAGAVALAVQPCFVPRDALIAQVNGSFNALSIYGHATGHTLYYGRGAGMMPTAGAVVADLMNIASGGYPAAFAQMRLWPDQQPPVKLVDRARQQSRFYIRINALDKPGTMAKVTAVLGAAGISLSAVRQHEMNDGGFVPVVITTHQAQTGALDGALKEIQKLDVIQGLPVCIRVVDMPEG